MANQALIQGAYAAAPKFSGAGDAFSQAFEARTQQFNEATKIADAKREELFSLVDNIELDDLGNTPEMTAAIMAEAKNAQNEYYEKVKNTNPFDPELRLEANKSSQKINQLQSLAATHQAFIKDIQDNKDLLSKVNGPDAYKMAMDFANLSIQKDKDGNYNFKDKDGNIITRKQLAEYQDSMIEVPVSIYNDLAVTTAKLAGQPNFQALVPMLKAKLQTSLSDKAYGNDFLFDSLGGTFNPLDKTDSAGGMRIAKYQGKTKAEILDMAPGKTEDEKIENLRNEVVTGYLDAFKESHRLLNPAAPKQTIAQTEGDRVRAIADARNRLLSNQLGITLNKLVEKQKTGKIYPQDIIKAISGIPNIQVVKDEEKDKNGEIKTTYSIVNTGSSTSLDNPISLGDFSKPGWGTAAIQAVEDALQIPIEYRQSVKIPPHMRNK
jgi:hypothetical protein